MGEVGGMGEATAIGDSWCCTMVGHSPPGCGADKGPGNFKAGGRFLARVPSTPEGSSAAPARGASAATRPLSAVARGRGEWGRRQGWLIGARLCQ